MTYPNNTLTSKSSLIQQRSSTSSFDIKAIRIPCLFEYLKGDKRVIATSRDRRFSGNLGRDVGWSIISCYEPGKNYENPFTSPIVKSSPIPNSLFIVTHGPHVIATNAKATTDGHLQNLITVRKRL